MQACVLCALTLGVRTMGDGSAAWWLRTGAALGLPSCGPWPPVRQQKSTGPQTTRCASALHCTPWTSTSTARLSPRPTCLSAWVTLSSHTLSACTTWHSVETLHDMPQGVRRITPHPQDSQATEGHSHLRRSVTCPLPSSIASSAQCTYVDTRPAL